MLSFALAVGVAHVLLGPDHYAPFAALAWERKWPLRKVLGWTAAAGVAHLAFGVLLGAGALALGVSAGLVAMESLLGRTIGWAMLCVGVLAAARGIRRVLRKDAPAEGLKPGLLFALVAFGPCEPLVPLMLASRGAAAVPALAVFAAATLGTMLAAVTLLAAGRRFVPARAQWTPALAGLAVAASGAAVLAGF